MRKFKIRTYQLIHAREVFRVSLLVVVLTVLFVWLAGLGMHHTFFENSILSLTILTIAFFSFITIGLYKGYKLRHVEEKKELKKGVSDFPGNTVDLLPSGHSPDFFDAGEGCAGAIAALLLWIVSAVIIAALLWLFANVIIVVVPLFMGMLYWIFFRAIRLVFKNSPRCKGDVMESIKIGLGYTVLYNFWIYGIFLLVHYFRS